MLEARAGFRLRFILYALVPPCLSTIVRRHYAVRMKTYRRHLLTCALSLGFICLLQAGAGTTTMHLNIMLDHRTQPAIVAIGVLVNSPTNPPGICYYVEYSDDMTNWIPLHTFDSSGTNTVPTVVCLTNHADFYYNIFYDVQAWRSPHRYYRSVETVSPQ